MRTGLILIAALLAATTGVKATGAAFTDGDSTTFTITTGSIAITRDGGGLVFDSAPLAPGDSATATVRVSNSGNRAADLSLARENLESTAPNGCAVRDALQLKIVEDPSGTSTTIVDAPLASAAVEHALGEFVPAHARSYEFTLTFAAQHGATAAGNDNCFQGSVDRERFTWRSVEA